MAAPLYLTKGELRSTLLLRLGYGGLGAGAGMFVPTADDLLEEAQEQLYEIFTDEKGVREWELTTGVNQRWYDIPATCDIDHIFGMWAQQSGDYWHPLTRGIDPAHDSDYEDIQDYPYRYDIRANEILSPELQINGNMNIDIPSGGTGDVALGWTWFNPGTEVANGVLALTATDLAYSSVPISSGAVYDIEYTVGVVGLIQFIFAGATADVYGTPFPTSTGTHAIRVEAVVTASPGFGFLGQAGTTIDNVSIKVAEEANTKTQIEIWPKPDQAYPMKIEGQMIISPFVNDGDRASFDSRLILLYAIAYGKAHLGRQDAKSAMDAWTLRLNRIKANQHGTRKYVRRNPSKPERHVLARPKVV